MLRYSVRLRLVSTLLLLTCFSCGVQGKAGPLWSVETAESAVAIEVHVGTLVAMAFRAKLMETRKQYALAAAGTFPLPFLDPNDITDIGPVIPGAYLSGGFNILQFDVYDNDDTFGAGDTDFGMFSPYFELGLFVFLYGHVYISASGIIEYDIRFDSTPNEVFYGVLGSVAIVINPFSDDFGDISLF